MSQISSKSLVRGESLTLFYQQEGTSRDRVLETLFDDPPVGIDLGTTFSCISVYRDGRADIIPDKNGDRLIPSMVFYDPISGNVLVGKDAYDEEPTCFGNCLKDVKRIIGRKFDDQFVKDYLRKKDVQFKLVKRENDMAVFEIEINGKAVTKTPEEVSAEILKYLRKMAERYLNKKISKVVISVPAYFSNAQRKATKKAAELAEFNVLRLITEPSAAGSYYVREKPVNGKILVFDWGGGTLDISLVKVENKLFEVQAVYGDTLLGGRDIDNTLFKYFYNKNVKNKRSVRRLLNMCIDLKKKLSTSEKCKLIIDYYNESGDLELSLNRQKFEALNKDVFDRALDIVKYGLKDVGWKKSDIEHVILVGGTTRIPKIQKMLKQYFDQKDCKTDLHPDEAVAAGASLQALRLKHRNRGAEEYKITEVTPLSLGIEIGDPGMMSTLIPRNSKLPIKKTSNFATTANNQSTVEFLIYEGERKRCSCNNKLGAFEITDLPLKRAGDVAFKVSFQLDEDGILIVTATESSSGKTEQLVVTMGEFRLSEKKIRLSVEESEKMKYEDDTFETFVNNKCKFKEYTLHIQYDLNKITDETYKEIVRDSCQQFLDEIELLDFTEGEKLEAKFKLFYDPLLQILRRYKFLSISWKV